MKVLVDPQIFNHQSYGGISRLFVEILKYKKYKNNNIKVYCPVYYTKNKHYLHHFKLKQFLFGLVKSFSDILLNLNLRLTCRKLSKNNYDIFLPSYYDPYFIKNINNSKIILTVYDMIHELYPSNFIDSDFIIANKKELIYKCDKIVAISENTKKDILKFYPEIKPQKIEVVYLSHSLDKSLLYSNRIINNDYILYVGNRTGYKNFSWLYENIREWIKVNNINLLCAGGGAFSEEEASIFKKDGMSDYIKYYDFKENELANLYKNAIAFIFPSKYEGFGIPILESMSCGCPTILANTSSFPEIAAEAGIYFSLESPDSLINILNLLVINPEIKNKHIGLGIKQSLKFNWENTITNYINIFNNAV
jgi:glycosyltransferase involved in cell wall biosynthesis